MYLNENLLCPFAVCASACSIVCKLAEHVKWFGMGGGGGEGVHSAHVLQTKSDEVVDWEEGGEAVRRANVSHLLRMTRKMQNVCAFWSHLNLSLK